MSRWVDQFNSHGIHDAVKKTVDSLDFKSEDIDSEVAAERRRLTKGIDFIQDILDGMDPELYPEAQLTTLANHLNQHVLPQISDYLANKNAHHLKNANDQFTSQIPTIFQLAAMSKPQESTKAIKGVEAAYDAFCEVIEKTKNDFSKNADERATELVVLEKRTKELSTSLDTFINTTGSQIGSWQSEFTGAQTTRAKEYSEAQIERSKEYVEDLRGFKATSETDLADATKKHDEAVEKAFEAFVSNVDAKTTDINAKHKSILDIHGLVTNDGVAGGYKKGADNEKVAALGWSVMSMVCYGIILLWVVFRGRLGFGIADLDGIDWSVVVTTLSVTAVAFVAAQFAGRQSRVHRMNEQRMRWFSFEIAAIDPFISSLPIEMQQELKRELSERLFGQDRVIEDGQNRTKGTDADTVRNLTDSISDLAKEAIRAIPR